jgi:hypothetical protein
MIDGETELITELSETDQRKIFSWVASLQVPLIIDIFQDAVKISYQIRAQRPELEGKVVKYSAFILAARKAGWDSIKGKGYRVADKKQYDDLSRLRITAATKFSSKGRTPMLRRKILAYWGEVTELRKEGLGFRSIADYLLQKRKIKTSETYLRMLWKEVTVRDV